MTDTIYQLTYGDYESERTIGIFATRALAERRIVRDALSGVDVRGAIITERQLIIDDIDDDTPEG
jgi:hypothetical protein